MFPLSPPPAFVPIIKAWVPLFFIAFISLYRRFISCCCLTTVSSEIARLAVNSAYGNLFRKVCVTSTVMLSRYPSSESRIWFGNGTGPVESVGPCRRSWPCTSFTAEPPKNLSSPSLATSARLFAIYASLKVVFHYIQVFWSPGSFDHSLVSVSYSPDWSINSKQAKLVIQNKYTHAVALKFILQSGEYETETREWSKLPDDQQTWPL